MELKNIDEAYRAHIDKIIRDSSGIKYEAMFLEPNLDAFHPHNAVELFYDVTSVYVLGILERSHLACITSLARTSRWLASTIRSVEDSNALAFSSSLRGLLESSSDSFHMLQHLFPTLESSYKYMHIALNYPKDLQGRFINFESLESLLIHYAYAKRWDKGEEPPPHHRNRSNSEYISCLKSFGVSGLPELYSELCQLTHPASPSVFCFVDEEEKELTFNPNRDSIVIHDILKRHQSSILGLIQYPLNSALMALAILHRLVPDWPAMSDKGMSTIGKMAKTLNDFDRFASEYRPGSGLSDAELKSASGL
jgi:hypothetical protein